MTLRNTFVRAIARTLPVSVVALALAVAGRASEAQAQPALPTLSGPVLDQADMLSSGEENRLGERIRGIEEGGGPQIQVWTFPSTEGDDIAAIGIRAAEAWKLGQKGKDDGAILLVAARERRTRLEVGRGLEGAVPDVVAGRILRDVLRPALRAGKTYDGFLGVVAAIEAYARGDSPLPADDENRPVPALPGRGASGGTPGGMVVFLLGLVFFVLLPLLGRGRRRRGRGFLGGGPIIIGGGGWGGGGWGGGGRGGGGGWSGGGGGFSGGGASGDW